MEYVITPALTKCGFKDDQIIRADQMSEPGIITSQIVDKLATADLVIADLTDHNPNVFYELAIRHVTRKPVVILIQQGVSIPFDVSPNRLIQYDLGQWDSPAQCKRELEAQIRAGVSGELANPISVALDLKLLRASPDPVAQSNAIILSKLESLSARIENLHDVVMPTIGMTDSSNLFGSHTLRSLASASPLVEPALIWAKQLGRYRGSTGGLVLEPDEPKNPTEESE